MGVMRGKKEISIYQKKEMAVFPFMTVFLDGASAAGQLRVFLTRNCPAHADRSEIFQRRNRIAAIEVQRRNSGLLLFLRAGSRRLFVLWRIAYSNEPSSLGEPIIFTARLVLTNLDAKIPHAPWFVKSFP